MSNVIKPTSPRYADVRPWIPPEIEPNGIVIHFEEVDDDDTEASPQAEGGTGVEPVQASSQREEA